MGILVSKIWSMLFADKEHKVIIVGLDNAGKTTILYQFLMNEVVQTSPTIGSNVEEVKWKNTQFCMWDIGGQESLRKDWSTYYATAEFLIFVIDSTDRERLHITKSELYNMLSHEELRHASLLIFANKQDVKLKAKDLCGNKETIEFMVLIIMESFSHILKNPRWTIDKHGRISNYICQGSMSAAELSEQLNLTSIRDHGWHMQACCALSGEGLYQGIEWLAQRTKK